MIRISFDYEYPYLDTKNEIEEIEAKLLEMLQYNILNFTGREILNEKSSM